MDLKARIYVAGHRGMVGSALMRRLTDAGYTNVLTRTHAELDLTNQSAVFRREREGRAQVKQLAQHALRLGHGRLFGQVVPVAKVAGEGGWNAQAKPFDVQAARCAFGQKVFDLCWG